MGFQLRWISPRGRTLITYPSEFQNIPRIIRLTASRRSRDPLPTVRCYRALASPWQRKWICRTLPVLYEDTPTHPNALQIVSLSISGSTGPRRTTQCRWWSIHEYVYLHKVYEVRVCSAVELAVTVVAKFPFYVLSAYDQIFCGRIRSNIDW